MFTGSSKHLIATFGKGMVRAACLYIAVESFGKYDSSLLEPLLCDQVLAK